MDTIMQITDIDIVSNTFRNVPVVFNIFGNSYSSGKCQPGPMDRIRVTNNIAELLSLNFIGTWQYSIPTNNPVNPAWPAGFVDHLNMTHNTSRILSASEPTSYSSAMTSDGDPAATELNTGLIMRDNILPANNYGIIGSSGRLGQAMLDYRWPNSTWSFTNNAFLRTGGTISGQPSGNTYPDQADMYWANYTANNYQFLAASPYRTNTYDGYPMGHDIATLNADQGRVANQRATGGSGTATFYWSYAGGAACTVDASNDNFATYTRGTSATTGYVQSKSLTLAAGSWSYQVLCPGTVDPVVTSTVVVE